MAGSGKRRSVPALTVHQWLPEWDSVEFDPNEFRSKPPGVFYLFTLPASELRALSGIYRRSTSGGRARDRDLGIQRRHEAERSDEIRKYVTHGFPWSALSRQRRDSGEFDDLKKPGWLPTSIVVNVLSRSDSRENKSVHADDAIDVNATNGVAEVLLPASFSGPGWEPQALPPLEVIDGQHRLWAFQDRPDAAKFDLPVVAFVGLDISWQAYLFYTINIKPKRINTSLAFDLYPLLRTEDWLERFEGHPIYRETRSQEITEALWSYSESPWHNRVNMLGERGSSAQVTQAAWIRSLMATFVKAFDARRVKVGGLFGAPIGEHKAALGWSRPQQSGFIIWLWTILEEAIASTNANWAVSLRQAAAAEDEATLPSLDAAFAGRHTLLNTDQGVRGFLAVANDILFVSADELHLGDWILEAEPNGTADAAISEALKSLNRRKSLKNFVESLSAVLASYDWRSAGAPDLSARERSEKARFRGSSGYRELRADLLTHVGAGHGLVADKAAEVADLLNLS